MRLIALGPYPSHSQVTSSQTPRLTTSTSGMRRLHHCASRKEKQMWTCRKFITLMKKACYQAHSRSWPARGNPLHGCHRKEDQARKKKRNDCSQKQHQKSWGMNTELISLTTVFVSWMDKLNTKQRNWALSHGIWTVPTSTRSTSWRIGRTTSSTSWNSYQEWSWNGKIEESSWINSRWVFEKKCDR